MSEGTPAGREELLARLDRERERLLCTIETVPPAARTTMLIGDWSLRDILAHVVAHERRALTEIEQARTGERFEIDHSANTAFDARVIWEAQPYSLRDMLGQWENAHDGIVALVDRLSPTDFAADSELARVLEDTVEGALANNTYDHYAEHRRDIEQALAREDT